MRYFRIKKRTKPIFISKATFVNITLLTGVLVFVALAAMTGKAVSDNLIRNDGTDHNDSVVKAEAQDTPASKTEEKMNIDGNGTTVSVAGKEYYLVQFGVFTSEKNARSCAASVSSMGGAGYIRQIDGNNYVFAMCYENMNDAKTVVNQLKGQGYSTVLKCFSHNGLEMKLSGNEIGISSIEAAMTGISGLFSKIEGVIYQFDKGETERTAVKQELQKLLEEAETYKDVFEKYTAQKDSQKIEQFERLGNFCGSVYNDVAGLIKAENDAELSSGLKYVYINSVFNLMDCIDNRDVR